MKVSSENIMKASPKKPIVNYKKDVELTQEFNQTGAFVDLLQIHSQDTWAALNAVTGAGKTYVSMKLAQEYKMRIIVLCPILIKGTWEKALNQYFETGQFLLIPITKISDYFQSIEDKQGVIRVQFTQNGLLKTKLELGALVVIDEISKLKNQTNGSESASLILKYALNSNGNCKVLFNSFSPFDKKIQVASFFNMIGVLGDGFKVKNNTTFVNPNMVDYNLFSDKIKTLNLHNKPSIIPNFEKSKGNWIENIFKLCVIYWNQHTTDIKGFTIYPNIVNFYDMFVTLDPTFTTKYKYGGVNEATVKTIFSEMGGSKTTKGTKTKEIEEAGGDVDKARFFALEYVTIKHYLIKLIVKDLEAGKRVVLGVNSLDREGSKESADFNNRIEEYTNDIKNLLHEDKKQKLVIESIHGQTTEKDRTGRSHNFMHGETHMIIINIVAGSMGINLQYTGEERIPTVVYLFANYNYLDMIQFLGRTVRYGVKSNTEQFLVWPCIKEGEGLKTSTSLHSNMMAKLEVSRQFSAQDRGPMLFPGEFKEAVDVNYNFIKSPFNQSKSFENYLDLFARIFSADDGTDKYLIETMHIFDLYYRDPKVGTDMGEFVNKIKEDHPGNVELINKAYKLFVKKTNTIYKS